MTEMDAEDGDSFSWELVKRGYARVAVLRGGMDCVRGATEEYTVNAIYESNGARSPITSSTRSTQSHSRTLSPSELLQTSAANALRTSNSTTDSTGANASTSAQAHGRGTIQRSSSGVQHTYRTSGQGGWDEKGVGSRRPRRPGRVMCSCYAPLTNAVTSVRGAMLRQCEYYK
ncbi:hypothetical protein SARC_01334 [Sphaeroforma arctica JP610]|uniref:Uncharacterized protein n=1 Tax=Sphaeroforma arctica JP610 TaxID=667725 RepID=A0A0L0GC60_9EUKA|nr:hypothetical protein SARC_01334 [Sphaeroforma arctica JP610]KNC86504.1 hypothetical protein SARC_01334 [Sphaeroforma arctica JP610]|eukprot:XP_014160406.1 hypothetical protein SARC_01334 [Sphaeroforma arctica JP610]